MPRWEYQMTISRKAIIDASGVVVGAVMHDDEAVWSPPAGCTLVDAAQADAPGDTYDAGTQTFTHPVVAVPQSKPEAWAAAATQAAKLDLLATRLGYIEVTL